MRFCLIFFMHSISTTKPFLFIFFFGLNITIGRSFFFFLTKFMVKYFFLRFFFIPQVESKWANFCDLIKNFLFISMSEHTIWRGLLFTKWKYGKFFFAWSFATILVLKTRFWRWGTCSTFHFTLFFCHFFYW